MRADPAAMITLTNSLVWIAALLVGACPALAADNDLAVAIVYDTSGSMKDKVPGRGGAREPKYVIANMRSPRSSKNSTR